MTDQTHTPRSKVAQLIEKYDLSGLGDELECYWTRPEDRYSLRQLADYFNRQLLKSSLDTNNSKPLDGEIDNLYRLLTEDDVTSGIRQQAWSRVEQRGGNVDSLQEDFVSYQSIRTYLQNYRNATPPEDSASDKDHRERKHETIQRLMSRLRTVTKQSLVELKNADRLTLGDFSVTVAVRVHCSDCDTQYAIIDLLMQSGCECANETSC